MDLDTYFEWVGAIILTCVALMLVVLISTGIIAIGTSVYKDYHQPATGTSCPLEKP